jgi:hypothetical protein
VEQLIKYKKCFLNDITDFIAYFTNYWCISQEDLHILFSTIQFQALGLNDNCSSNPIAEEAAQAVGLPQLQYL